MDFHSFDNRKGHKEVHGESHTELHRELQRELQREFSTEVHSEDYGQEHTQDPAKSFGEDGYHLLRTANNSGLPKDFKNLDLNNLDLKNLDLKNIDLKNIDQNFLNLNSPESEAYLRNYLKQYICDVQKVARAENILVVEDDSRIQRVLQNLIQEENATAQCRFLDSVDDFLGFQQRHAFDLVIVNYYLADDEVDYDFWEQVREDFPGLEVILLSHVNDREYYEMLEKIGTLNDKLSINLDSKLENNQAREGSGAGGTVGTLEVMTAKMKNFIEHIFGGRNGNQ